MNKISINHIKGIYKCNNDIFYNGMFLNYQIMCSINQMIERDLKFGVKNYDICFLGNINKIYIHHKSNKKRCFSRRKQIGL